MSSKAQWVSGARPQPQHRTASLVSLTVAALALTACANQQGGLPSGIKVPSIFAPKPAPGAAPAPAQAAAPVPVAPVVALAPVQPAAPTPPVATRSFGPAPAPAPSPAPTRTRSEQQLRALMAKGTVTGADLRDELIAVRRAAHEQRTNAAMTQFLGTIDQPATPAQPQQNARPNDNKIDFKKLLDSSGTLVEEIVKRNTTTIAYDALDIYLGQLLDDPKALASESIALPQPNNMTVPQMQRIVTMASIVIAARVSNRVLKRARDDFAGIEAGYADLIDRREKAAALLYEFLARRGKAGDGGPPAGDAVSTLAPQDMTYLDDAVARLTLREFANDLGAQNLALEYLRQADPQAFAQYRAQADGTLRRTQAYVRTVSGVAAFGGLTTSFVREGAAAARRWKDGSAAQALPYGVEFIKEAVPLAALSAETSTQGVVIQPLKQLNPRRFRLVNGGKTDEVGNAQAVYAGLQQRNSQGLLVESLFRNESPGLLYRLYQCDRGETGRMLDAAVPQADREAFARDYLRAELAPGFAFLNAFATPGASNRERDLGDDLLRSDHRVGTDDPSRALSRVQDGVAGRYQAWSDEQLMRLIFANREGAAALATLQLGDTYVRPVPSMQSVYVYESLVDGCRGLVDRTRAASDPAPAQAFSAKKGN